MNTRGSRCGALFNIFLCKSLMTTHATQTQPLQTIINKIVCDTSQIISNISIDKKPWTIVTILAFRSTFFILFVLEESPYRAQKLSIVLFLCCCCTSSFYGFPNCWKISKLRIANVTEAPLCHASAALVDILPNQQEKPSLVHSFRCSTA